MIQIQVNDRCRKTTQGSPSVRIKRRILPGSFLDRTGVHRQSVSWPIIIDEADRACGRKNGEQRDRSVGDYCLDRGLLSMSNEDVLATFSLAYVPAGISVGNLLDWLDHLFCGGNRCRLRDRATEQILVHICIA